MEIYHACTHEKRMSNFWCVSHNYKDRYSLHRTFVEQIHLNIPQCKHNIQIVKWSFSASHFSHLNKLMPSIFSHRSCSFSLTETFSHLHSFGNWKKVNFQWRKINKIKKTLFSFLKYNMLLTIRCRRQRENWEKTCMIVRLLVFIF